MTTSETGTATPAPSAATRKVSDRRIALLITFPNAVDVDGQPAATVSVVVDETSVVTGAVVSLEGLRAAFTNWDEATLRAINVASSASHRRLAELNDARKAHLQHARQLLAAANHLVRGSSDALDVPSQATEPTALDIVSRFGLDQVACSLTLDVGSSVDVPGWNYRASDREGYNEIHRFHVSGYAAVRMFNMLGVANNDLAFLEEVAAAATEAAANDLVRWAAEAVTRACPPASD